MKISVKCPNCFQEVPEGNRFCIHCGYDLSGDAADSSAAKASVPVPTEAGRGAAAAFFTGPRFCPKGHDVPDPSLGFCPVCGLPLVNERSAEILPSEEPAPPGKPEPVRSGKPRTCRHCGYDCDDPELSFCPSCGMPLDLPAEETPKEKSGGGLSGKAGKEHSPEPEETLYIPAGMFVPGESDLEVKSAYGR